MLTGFYLSLHNPCSAVWCQTILHLRCLFLQTGFLPPHLTMPSLLMSHKLLHKLREPTLLNILLFQPVLAAAAGFASCLKEWWSQYHSGISSVPLECITWRRHPLLISMTHLRTCSTTSTLIYKNACKIQLLFMQR